MEPNQQMSGQNMQNGNMMMPKDKKGGTGAMIASIIIIIIIILGGLYFFKSAKDMKQDTTGATSEEQVQLEASTDVYVQTQSNQGSSDELSDIEADINSTDIESLDAGL